MQRIPKSGEVIWRVKGQWKKCEMLGPSNGSFFSSVGAWIDPMKDENLVFYQLLCKKHGERYDAYGYMHANCTCTVVRSPKNTVIVDTMTTWDGPFILSKLKEIGVNQIDYVISTHGHSDHIGNNNLFIENVKQHIVGYCINYKDQYYAHPFEHDEDYVLDEWMRIVPTPGHTSEDVTLLAETKDGTTVAVAGDLFECEDDLKDSTKWIANSFNPEKQAISRLKILKLAKSIIPGHGAQFAVLPEHVEAAQKLADKYSSPIC